MLKLAVLCCTALAATATAQCTPNTLAGSNQGGNAGNAGGGIYFDLTVTQTITITDMNFRAGLNGSGGPNSMEVYMGPATWVGNATSPALWTLVDTTVAAPISQNATALNPGILTPGVLTNGIVLSPGTYGMALRSVLNRWNHNYSNPGAPNPVTTPELTMTCGGATNGFMVGSVFQTRIWNGEIVYTCGGTPQVVATSEPYGDGSNKFNTSYGEIIPNPATSMDIAGQTHTLQFLGATYSVSGTTTNTYAPPGGSAVILPLATNVDIASVATALGGSLPFPILYPAGHIAGGVGVADDLEVCSSGFITPVDVGGAGTSAAVPGAQQGDPSATIDEFFNVGIERWCPYWQDMTPVTNVFVEVDANNDLVISWVAVNPTGLTSVNTFQVAFSVTGTVTYRYDITNTGGGGGGWPCVMGLTQGNGALENEIDVSVDVLAGFQTHAIDNTALDISLDARPVLGTSPNIVLDGFDPVQVGLGFVLFDFTQVFPGGDLGPFGMPGALHYVPLTAANRAFVPGGVAPATLVLIGGGIPNSPSFNGLQFYTQAAALQANCAGQPCNALGITVSNGLRIYFGAL